MIDELDQAGLEEVLETEFRGVLVDFWSPWCAPCRALRPHLAKLAEEHDGEWRFVAVNTEEVPASAEAYGVRSLPTLVFFRKGEELHRFAGSALVSSVSEKLEELST